jgi:hypothetical protein
LSQGATIGLAVVVVAGLVAALVAYLNYRVKIQREMREQQLQGNSGSPIPPASPRPIESNRVAVLDENLIVADVVWMPSSSPPERTMEAIAIGDPATTAAMQGTVGNTDAESPGSPHFKDQTRTVISPGPSVNTSGESTKRNNSFKDQRTETAPHAEEEKQDERRRTRDPPAKELQYY